MEFADHSTALVLLSGGLDSTVALAWALERYGRDLVPNVSTISFRYGQRHTKELESAEKIARFYHVSNHVVDLPPDIFHGSGSSLMGESDVPDATYGDMGHEGPSSTYVPYRNGVFLSIAAARAQALGISTIVGGYHANDALHWAYPDCTNEFLGPMAASVFVGTYGKVRLQTPFVYHMKRDIVDLGFRLKAPFKLTWSCYNGGELACGKCPTCVERLEAFSAGGHWDPVEYQA